MSMDWVGVATLALGALALAKGAERMFIVLIASVLFQAAAAVKIGSNSITPPHVLLAFAAAALLMSGRMIQDFEEAISFARAGFWLLLFSFWSIIAAYFLPRIFAGSVDVFPITPSAGAAFLHPEPLTPSGGNVTQAIYVAGSLFVFLAVYSFISDRRRAFIVCDALILFSLGNAFFALTDLGGYLIGRPDLLDPIHNAGYVMHTNEAVAGFHRISGTFSETAAFAFITLGSLPFTIVLFLSGYKTRLTLIASVSQFALLLASTSTTACVGLLLVMMFLMMKYVFKLGAGRANHREATFVFAMPVVALAVLVALYLDTDAWNGVRNFLDVVVFDKGTSDSAMDRGAMNAQAISVFFATGGLGAGTGSVRTSSFPLAVIASVGIPGVIFYGGFLARLFFGRGEPQRSDGTAMIREAARAAAVGSLVAATISGALVDMGLLFFIFAALACAIGERGRRHLRQTNLETGKADWSLLPATPAAILE